MSTLITYTCGHGTSAATHCGVGAVDSWLEMGAWKDRWNISSWQEYLKAGNAESEITAIRQCTHTGRPLGTEEFIRTLEGQMQRQLAPQKGGRPGKSVEATRQCELIFDSQLR